MKILVTGGAGYIGSHTANRLTQAGYQVVIIDNLSTGSKKAIPQNTKFYECDLLDFENLNLIFKNEKFDAVIHFAAKLNVKESTEQPLVYYKNNVDGLAVLLDAMIANQVDKIIFSSSGSVYGNQIQNRPITENDLPVPINPYSESKLTGEKMLTEVSKTKGIKHCILRYFNAAGAADDGFNGQRTENSYHLIHVGSQAALGKLSEIKIFGTSYPTFDGTCIRDYIHVEDLAEVHILALKALVDGNSSQIYNCGYGNGYSVKQVIEALENVSHKKLNIIQAPNRPGDAISLVADPSKLKKDFNWIPKRNNLQLICKSALEWERTLNKN